MTSMIALHTLTLALADPGAAAPTADRQCLTYDQRYAEAPLMTVSGHPGSRIHLRDRPTPCEASACSSARSGYVVPGDVVFASAPLDGFRCVYMGSRGRLTAGFLPTSLLSPTPDAGPITPIWLTGRWSNGTNLVVVSGKDGRLDVNGDGVWPARGFTGVPGHIGGFHGMPVISGTSVRIVDGACAVDGHRRGPYLVLDDNQNCGGLNVRFRGIYVSGSELKP